MIKGEYLPGLSLSRLLGKAGMNWGNEEWQVKQVMKKEKKEEKRKSFAFKGLWGEKWKEF